MQQQINATQYSHNQNRPQESLPSFSSVSPPLGEAVSAIWVNHESTADIKVQFCQKVNVGESPAAAQIVWKKAGKGDCWESRKPGQVYKPGSVPNNERRTAVAGRLPSICAGRCRPALATYPRIRASNSPLLGLAPGKACRAPQVTRRPVGSYPAFSPLPGAAGVTADRLRAVCFLWRCLSLSAIRLRREPGSYPVPCSAEPGLSSAIVSDHDGSPTCPCSLDAVNSYSSSCSSISSSSSSASSISSSSSSLSTSSSSVSVSSRSSSSSSLKRSASPSASTSA